MSIKSSTSTAYYLATFLAFHFGGSSHDTSRPLVSQLFLKICSGPIRPLQCVAQFTLDSNEGSVQQQFITYTILFVSSFSLPLPISIPYIHTTLASQLDSLLVCRNICLRYPRIQVGYLAGGKFCRRCEYYFFTERLFCECCGMRLRASPTNREFKEKVRAKKRLVTV